MEIYKDLSNPASKEFEQLLNSKLDALVDGINKINENFNDSNKVLKKEIISELKSVGKRIQDLEK